MKMTNEPEETNGMPVEVYVPNVWNEDPYMGKNGTAFQEPLCFCVEYTRTDTIKATPSEEGLCFLNDIDEAVNKLENLQAGIYKDKNGYSVWAIRDHLVESCKSSIRFHLNKTRKALSAPDGLDEVIEVLEMVEPVHYAILPDTSKIYSLLTKLKEMKGE